MRNLSRQLLALSTYVASGKLNSLSASGRKSMLKTMQKEAHRLSATMTLADLLYVLTKAERRMVVAALKHSSALEKVLSAMAKNRTPTDSQLQDYVSSYPPLYRAFQKAR